MDITLLTGKAIRLAILGGRGSHRYLSLSFANWKSARAEFPVLSKSPAGHIVLDIAEEPHMKVAPYA